jgi:glutamate N-acetyltransferase/amino-acid N-acetyltransferase
LPAEKITGHLSDAWSRLADANSKTWMLAANAIMTTDTFAKGAGQRLQIAGCDVNIAGIAKGSGMIAPDMATMLAFIFTDAAIPAPILQELLSQAVDKSFNAITVDSDTSTSDTVLLMATGTVEGQPKISSFDTPDLLAFKIALQEVLISLAQQIVRDGEGATKFITVTVEGAENDLAARRIGLAIANSPLVKTAISGEDANWGRIVMAVGKSGEIVDRDTLSIEIGGHTVARNGVAVDGYDEAPIAAHMKNDEIGISVDIGLGYGHSTVWTCDLSHGYISINADYRS